MNTENNINEFEIQKTDKQPIEQYSFSFSKKDADNLCKAEIIPRIIRIAMITCFLTFASFANFRVNTPQVSMENVSVAPVFITVILIYLVVKTAGLIKTIKKWKKTGKEYEKLSYTYSFFPSEIHIDISNDDTHVCTQLLNIREIQKIERFEKYIKLISGKNIFILKQNEMPETSPFLQYINSNAFVKSAPINRKYSRISTSLILISVFSFFAATIINATVMLKSQTPDPSSMWTFFLFVPFPLASVIFGIISKKKCFFFKRNIVVGLILCFVFCVYGSFSFAFKDVFTDNPELFIETENLTGIDLPDYTRISTQDWTNGTQSTSRGYIITTTKTRMTNINSEAFRITAEKDTRWLKKIPTTLMGITSAFCDNIQDEYVLIFNADTGEYNSLPEESGTYRFVNIIFSYQNDSLTIVDYELEYIA